MTKSIFSRALAFLCFLIIFNSHPATALPTCNKSPVDIESYIIFNPHTTVIHKWHMCIGKTFYRDGTSYEGRFVNGKWDGYGVHVSNMEPKGKRYVSKGFWKEGFMDGEHYMLYEDGTVKEGLFKFDKEKGQMFYHPLKTRFSDKVNSLRDEFQALALNERKAIQQALKKTGYYRASIDGQYGPNTALALNKFNTAHLKSSNLQDVNNVTELFVEILFREKTYEPEVVNSNKNISTQKVYYEFPRFLSLSGFMFKHLSNASITIMERLMVYGDKELLMR